MTIKTQTALDKKAAVAEPHKNARELGLDYEPAPVQEKNQSPYPEYDRGFSNGWDRGFAAAQKPWVGLTDEESEELWGGPLDVEPHPELELEWVRIIEAKLKEKNT